jgi:hypothetical protein
LGDKHLVPVTLSPVTVLGLKPGVPLDLKFEKRMKLPSAAECLCWKFNLRTPNDVEKKSVERLRPFAGEKLDGIQKHENDQLKIHEHESTESQRQLRCL